MIETLPVEIILNIASYLNFYSQLNLANSSHRLRKTLQSTILLQDLIIPPKHTNQVLLHFKKVEEKIHQYVGARVQSCCIDHTRLDKTLLLELPNIFPRLKRIIFPQPSYSGFVLKEEIQVIERLKNTLEVADTWIADGILILFVKHEFSRLKTLDLRDTRFRISSHRFHCFANLPCLESLDISMSTINLKFLESIHTTNPTLKRLVIHNNVKMMNATPSLSEEQRQDIKPATSMETFKMISRDDFGESNHFLLVYMIKKYPNLKTLDLFMSKGNPRSNINRKPDQGLLNLLGQIVSRLETIKINSYLLEGFLSDGRIESVEQIKSMGIYMHNSIPSNTCSPIKRLSYLESLTCLTSMSFPLQYTKYMYNRNVTLPNLKSLYLFDHGFVLFGASFIQLDELLFTYNGLESLKIDTKYATITSTDTATDNHGDRDDGSAQQVTDVKKYKSLRRIDFSVVDMQQQAIEFIKNSVPNLCYFDLCTSKKSNAFSLILPQHTFYSLALDVTNDSDLDSKWICRVKIKAEQDDERKIHCINQGQGDVKITNRDSEEEDFQVERNISIVCKRLLELKYKNMIVF